MRFLVQSAEERFRKEVKDAAPFIPKNKRLQGLSLDTDGLRKYLSCPYSEDYITLDVGNSVTLARPQDDSAKKTKVSNNGDPMIAVFEDDVLICYVDGKTTKQLPTRGYRKITVQSLSDVTSITIATYRSTDC